MVSDTLTQLLRRCHHLADAQSITNKDAYSSVVVEVDQRMVFCSLQYFLDSTDVHHFYVVTNNDLAV
jgi:hypothetical protein